MELIWQENIKNGSHEPQSLCGLGVTCGEHPSILTLSQLFQFGKLACSDIRELWCFNINFSFWRSSEDTKVSHPPSTSTDTRCSLYKTSYQKAALVLGPPLLLYVLWVLTHAIQHSVIQDTSGVSKMLYCVPMHRSLPLSTTLASTDILTLCSFILFRRAPVWTIPWNPGSLVRRVCWFLRLSHVT